MSQLQALVVSQHGVEWPPMAHLLACLPLNEQVCSTCQAEYPGFAKLMGSCRAGWRVEELTGAVALEEFAASGGMLPVAAADATEALQFVAHVFARWVSTLYMAYAQVIRVSGLLPCEIRIQRLSMALQPLTYGI